MTEFYQGEQPAGGTAEGVDFDLGTIVDLFTTEGAAVNKFAEFAQKDPEKAKAFLTEMKQDVAELFDENAQIKIGVLQVKIEKTALATFLLKQMIFDWIGEYLGSSDRKFQTLSPEEFNATFSEHTKLLLPAGLNGHFVWPDASTSPLGWIYGDSKAGGFLSNFVQGKEETVYPFPKGGRVLLPGFVSGEGSGARDLHEAALKKACETQTVTYKAIKPGDALEAPGENALQVVFLPQEDGIPKNPDGTLDTTTLDWYAQIYNDTTTHSIFAGVPRLLAAVLHSEGGTVEEAYAKVGLSAVPEADKKLLDPGSTSVTSEPVTNQDAQSAPPAVADAQIVDVEEPSEGPPPAIASSAAPADPDATTESVVG